MRTPPRRFVVAVTPRLPLWVAGALCVFGTKVLTKVPRPVIMLVVASADDLIPAAEAARILRISVATLHRRAAAGEVPEVAKLPGLRGPRLFRRSEVEALLTPAEPTEAAS